MSEPRLQILNEEGFEWVTDWTLHDGRIRLKTLDWVDTSAWRGDGASRLRDLAEELESAQLVS